MIRLFAALAASRDQVDRAIAFGEAIPRLEKLRRVVLAGLTVAVFILSISYIHLTNEMDSVRQHQEQANVERGQILHQLQVAQGDRWVIMKALVGKKRASLTATP